MLAKRLAEARKRAGLAQIDLAVALGGAHTQQMISLVERGSRGLRPGDIAKAAKELSTSADYLLGLTDDPTPPSSRTNQVHAVADTKEKYEVDPDETIYRLDEVAAAAGSGAESYDETVTAKVPFRSSWLRRNRINPRHCHLIRVLGDSMEPTLPSGCQVMVDHSRRELRDGRIYVMRTENGLVVKRVKQNAQGWWLMSDNPGWAPLYLTEETDIIGEVRWMGRVF